jgi:hypothetical protein
VQIEYKVKFEDGGVTITQTMEQSHRVSVGRGSGARPGRQLGSTLVETQHLDRLAGGPNEQGVGGGPNDQGVGGGPNDQGVGGGPNDQGVGGGPNDQGVGGGPNDQGVGGGPNDQGVGGGGRAIISRGGHAAGRSGKVSAVIFGPIVVSGF